MPANEYEDYLESESLRTGNTYIYRAGTGIIETYSDGKLTEVTGTRPSSSGGGYISVVPSTTVSGGYTVSTDTPRGGTSVTELSGTTTATQEQFRQGAFSTTTYDYPSTVPKEQRIGLVEQRIASAQVRPVAYTTPTSSYVPSTTDKYLPLVSPLVPANTEYLKYSASQTPLRNDFNQQRNFFSFDKGKAGFDNKFLDFTAQTITPFPYMGYKALSGDIESKENLKSVGIYGTALLTWEVPYLNIVTVPLAVNRVTKDVGRFSGGKEYYDYYNTKDRLEMNIFIEKRSSQNLARGDTKGVWDGADFAQLKGDVFGGFINNDVYERRIILEEVKQKFLEKGYSPDKAEKYTEFALRETTFREYGEFTSLISANAISNRVAGKSYLKALEVANTKGVFGWKATSQAITKSMVPAGFGEGVYTVYNYETSRYGKANPIDVAVGGVVGAGSASLIQGIIDIPATVIKTKFTGVIGTSTGSGIQKGTQYDAYILDPISEPAGDFVDYLAGSKKTFKISVKTPVQVSGYSGITGGVYSFTFSNPLTSLKTSSNPYTKASSNSQNLPTISSQNFININPRPNPRKSDLGFLNTQDFGGISTPNTNPFPNPRPNPIPNPVPDIITKNNPLPVPLPKNNPFPNPYPNPFPNVNPNTNPFVNTFVGGDIPFIPPMGGGYGKGFGLGTRTKQKRGYVPSLTAIGFNIRAKKGRRIDVASGLSIRPII